ncbi:hypothetical protein IAG44_27770 [Streptomyces roseirectus]|uniref:Uncharacterized protein n=1 Tax=Streptomyces roseirectus TaxID=2768066 RepID=A0A7H0IJ90_9ACTN|nr:hypothetical protein [Streptomyces roseirectus]QNP72856.1 hypothetical protein IAG44_27770 [Streptomyces roseirectus]
MTELAGSQLSQALSAVDEDALVALAEEYHARTVRSLGSREVAGHLVKVYAIEAPGRRVTEVEAGSGLRVAGEYLASARSRGSLGLSVLLVHAGGDGDYVLVQTWIEGYMSDLAIFTGPAGDAGQLRPGRQGLAPCVWEAAVLAHERDAFARHVLDGRGGVEERLAAWRYDVLEGDVR